MGIGSVVLGFVFGCWFGFITAVVIAAGKDKR